MLASEFIKEVQELINLHGDFQIGVLEENLNTEIEISLYTHIATYIIEPK